MDNELLPNDYTVAKGELLEEKSCLEKALVVLKI